MPEIEISKLQDAVAALQRRREYPNLVRARSREEARRVANRQAVAKSVEQAFLKAGLDMTELDQLARRNRAELRHVIEMERNEAASRVRADALALRHGLEGRLQALHHLVASPIGPFAPSFTTLDKPFLILQLPHSNVDQLVDSHIESLNSWARIRFTAFPFTQGETSFHFFFMWENADDFYAVVNVLSPLVLIGSCDVYADTGIFSGDSTYLTVSGDLMLLEWWNQPPTNPFYEESQHKIIKQLGAQGGSVLDSQAHDGVAFASEPFDLKYDLFAVPPNSVSIFDVSLTLTPQFGFDTQEGNHQDEVVVDFSNVDLVHRVICPFVQLELLTKPPSAS
jgi:hypothetical protein